MILKSVRPLIVFELYRQRLCLIRPVRGKKTGYTMAGRAVNKKERMFVFCVDMNSFTVLCLF